MRSVFRHKGLTAAAAVAVLAGGALTAGQPLLGRPAADDAAPPSLMREFTTAAREFKVPVPVLMAVAYCESRWDGHDGGFSADGGYGLMDLTDVTPAMAAGGGTGSPAGAALHTLRAAARLTGIAPERLRGRDADNLRGGAALLAADEQRLTGGTPATPADWYGAVELYSRSLDAEVARDYADEVYRVLAAGAARAVGSGERVALAAMPRLRPVRRPVPGLREAPAAGTDGTAAPQCPAGVRCTVVPAAARSYQRADRPADGLDVRYIVIHDTEGGYDASVTAFTQAADGAAANYVMRSSDGAVTQMVPDEDIAFHAGNYWFNMHAVGIEHEGFAASGATWYTEAQYRATAALVRYLAARYGVPLDRQHIIGHDNVPGVSPSTIKGMHWDPGPYWDWNHFMELLGVPVPVTGGGMPATGQAVTVAPAFAGNRQTVTVCGEPTGPRAARRRRRAAGCRTQREPSDFLFVRTAPSATAPLFGDPALHGSGHGSDVISDWGSAISAGQRFVVAGTSGDWTAVWFAGAKVWFANPHGVNTAPAPGSVIVSARGPAAAPVYGVAFPQRQDYPDGLKPSDTTPLRPYAVPRGQAYVATRPPVDADDFFSPSGVVVTGPEQYWTVQFGHRLGLLDAADVSAREG